MDKQKILQSSALPTELSKEVVERWCCQTLIKQTQL